MPSIASVVATHNRPEFLEKRSLASIVLQTRPPDYLVVVDDSDMETRSANAGIVARLVLPRTRAFYLENRRTPGASGAWNTALSHLQEVDQSVFIAVLDDDDGWTPTYLEECERAVLERDLDMVASGLVFIRSRGSDGDLLDPPGSLNARDLMVRNTHIQGSNLFVRLRKLIEAGGFDEALTSTTDRDICIRLADLGTVKYGALNEHLVHHFADNDRPRLSRPGGDAKRSGLTHFYRKYRGRMSGEQDAAFLERSRRLFDCDPAETIQMPPPALPVSSGDPADGPLVLVAGSITSPETGLVARLLDSLVEKIAAREEVTLKVVLLENGGHDAESRGDLRKTVRRASRQGLDVVVKTLEQQAVDAAAGVFSATPEQLSQRKSIALGRTMLQHYLFMEAKPLQGAVVWILDDDVVLEGPAYGSDGPVQAQDIDYVSTIRRLKGTGASVVLCEVTGDPPLPSLSCVRTQMVDLYHNLHRLASLSPEFPFPDLRDENRLARLDNPDYYYDLSSRGTCHLELPFWFETEGKSLTRGDVFREMAGRLSGIMSGIQVFRPLVRSESGDAGAALSPSLSRGPATLVFDLQALREFPNAVPSVNGADIRRSDMVWSLLTRFAGGREVLQAPLPVRQVRLPSSGGAEGNFATVEQDIRGHALYSCMSEVLEHKVERLQRNGQVSLGRDLLEFSDHEVEQAAALYWKYLRRRSLAFEMSFIRIMGLVSAMRPFCQTDPCGDLRPWWLESAEFEEAATRLRGFVDTLALTYTEAQLEAFKRRMGEFDIKSVVGFLRELPGTADRHRANTPLPARRLQDEAEAYVSAEFGTGPLTCLGIGEEGVVLTDGRLVYKYFHYWKARDRERRISFLQSLAGRLSGYRTLPEILEVRREGDNVVAVYPYEEGTRYEGGHLQELLTLLRETRQAGIACRNIHPDNLVVTPGGVKFIDYGSDIVPINDHEFEQMCRRAFLTYRFPFRSDLKRLMTRALMHSTLPELAGLDRFLEALDPRGLEELYHRPMADLVAAHGPKAVMDYGCGKGRLTEELTRRGVRVIGYDPDPASIARCLQYGSQAAYGGRKLLETLRSEDARFDTVVCGRVLCTIADDSEFKTVLADLRRLVADSGTVLVAVCNPFHLATVSTELGEKHLPDRYKHEGTFVYDKTVAINGNRRSEVHRSFPTYRRAFSDAGFRTAGVTEFDGVDTRALLPASDHLVFRLTPVPTDGPRVSLLIKTCLMEWRTIERLIRHQVSQLETPVRFVEKVVVVDTFEGPFARQYDQPDPEAHRAAMERLLSDGVVDRVVYAPTDPETVRTVYRKWFGQESVETHSGNGQQLFATLFGFDSCSGDYVLQVDSDLLIARGESAHNYLGDMTDVLRRDPKALFVTMSICQPGPVPYTHEGPNGDWRVEVRGCLFDRERLRPVLPVPNELKQDRFTLSWHRAFDRFIASSDYRSYRGGNPTTAFIHVPNDRKTGHEEWLDVIGSVERGHVPAVQMGSVELVGSGAEWAGPKRHEPFIFVICGRNVEPARFRRCFDSLPAQKSVDWGAVVVDDASTNGFGDYARVLLADYAQRVTLVRNEYRRGGLYNTWNAVVNFCADPESVIITLDADDTLIGEHVLERVQAEYQDGADVTVGSMLRLDKEAFYPPNFDNPRRWDSNVWQHLRTFRKRLFDAIDVEDLKIDGEWIDLAADWAFMVPIVEVASSPRHIEEPLYLYEPAVPKDEGSRQERDSVIARILVKDRYARMC